MESKREVVSEWRGFKDSMTRFGEWSWVGAETEQTNLSGHLSTSGKIRIGTVYGIKSEKATAPHSSTLAWKIPWMEEPGGLQSMGSQRVGHD